MRKEPHREMVIGYYKSNYPLPREIYIRQRRHVLEKQIGLIRSKSFQSEALFTRSYPADSPANILPKPSSWWLESACVPYLATRALQFKVVYSSIPYISETFPRRWLPQVEGGYLGCSSSEQNWGRHITWRLPKGRENQWGSVKRSVRVILLPTLL